MVCTNSIQKHFLLAKAALYALVVTLCAISSSSLYAQDDCQLLEQSLDRASILGKSGKFDQGITICDSILETNMESCAQWGETWIVKGTIFTEKGDFAAAFQAIEKAMPYATQHVEISIQVNLNLSILYRRSAQPEKALKYIRAAMKKAKEQDINTYNGSLFTSFANLIGDIDLDSAFIYYKKSAQSHARSCPSCQSTVFNNIAVNYSGLGLYDSALVYIGKSLALDKVAHDSLRMMRTYFNLGRVEFLSGKKVKAKEHLRLAKKLARKFNWIQSIPTTSGFLAAINYSDGQYGKAQQQIIKIAMLQDSLLNAGISEKVTSAMEDNAWAETEMKKELLKTENALLQRDKWILRGSIFFALLIIALLIIVAFNTHLQRKKLSTLNRSLDQQNEQLNLLLKDKDTFMYVLAHDLKSPLASLSALFSLMNEDDLDPEIRKEIVREGRICADSGLQLIEDLTLLFRTETTDSVDKKPVDLHKLTRNIQSKFDPIIKQKNQKVQYTIPESTSLLSNESMLGSIIENLLSNASKYSPLGSSLSFTVRQSTDQTIFEIADSGPGFSPEDQKKAFGKFQKLSARPTGNEYSSGLGLYLVKLQAEKLGGKIQLESKMGEGSTFSVYLPK